MKEHLGLGFFLTTSKSKSKSQPFIDNSHYEPRGSMLDTYKNKGSSFSVVQFLIFHPEVVDGVFSNTKVNSENVEEISEEE